jgi:hypothetical protein
MARGTVSCEGVGCPEKEYDTYIGTIFFITESNWKNNSIPREVLRHNSQNDKVKRGKVCIELSPGTYYAVPVDLSYSYNIITINSIYINDFCFSRIECTIIKWLSFFCIIF